jgi:phosphatidylinositol glycan class T
LLPCNSKAGIASLLNPHRIFDGNYQSLTVHWIPKCVDQKCEKVEYEFIQTVSMVLDPVRSTKTRGL